jgi:hypothetical protein
VSTTPECSDNVQIVTDLATTNVDVLNRKPIGLATLKGFSTPNSTMKNSLVAGLRSSTTKTGKPEMIADSEGVDLLKNHMAGDTTGKDVCMTVEEVDPLNRLTQVIPITPANQPNRITTTTQARPIEVTTQTNNDVPKLQKKGKLVRQSEVDIVVEEAEAEAPISHQVTSGIKLTTTKPSEIKCTKPRRTNDRKNVCEVMKNQTQMVADAKEEMTMTRAIPGNPAERQHRGREIEDIEPEIIFWNCCHGLSSKINFVRDFLINESPVAMFIAEAELSRYDEINAGFFYVQGYSLLHSETREKRGNSKLKSRICAYVRDDIKYFRQKGLEGLNEVIILDLMGKWRVVGIYRQFKLLDGETECSNFDRLIECLNKASIAQNLDVVCIGDLNVDWRKDSSFKSTLQSWSDGAHLSQLVKEITRYRSITTKTGENRVETGLLDHVYVPTHLENEFKVTHHTTHLSDHEIIQLSLVHSRKKRGPSKNTKILLRDWRKYDPEKLWRNLMIDRVHSNKPVMEILKDIFEALVPERVCRFKPEFGDVPNAKVAKIRKRRDRLIKSFKKSGNEQLQLAAREATKDMKKIIKKERKRVLQKKLETPNPKAFWTVINNLLGKRSFDKMIEIETEGRVINDPTEVSELFVSFFKQKVISLARTLPNPVSIPVGPPIIFTTTELLEALKSIKSKHCFGLNGLPLRIVKDFCSLAPELAVDVLNDMSRVGLNDIQKTARIIPLHKKGARSELSNYRPIANLCSVTKIYEKLLLKRLLDETQGLEGLYQHGFRRSHSTTTALLQIQDIIARHLDVGKKCLIYSVDLSAAFDVFRPDVFMKLYGNKLSHGLARAIADFLTNRRIICEVGGKRSTPREMPLGCVQGSILGPRLFALYMGQLVEAIGHEDTVGFADDTYVIISGNSTDDLTKKLHDISIRHVSYLESLGMVVNKAKTEIMFLDKVFTPQTVCFAGISIESTKHMKALGITISHDLKWNEHLRILLPKAHAKLSLLRKVRPVLTRDQFIQIATSQIFSTTYYAAPVWLNQTLGSKEWKRMDSFHYRVMRVAINDFKRNKKRKVIDSLCKRATPKMWSNYISASTALKIVRDLLPSRLATSINETMVTERRRPRNGRFFDNSKLRVGRHSFANRLGHLNDISGPWLYPTPSDDAIRTLLKRHFNFDFKVTNRE